MSIANSLQRSVNMAREMHRRENGDLEIFLPYFLDDLERAIELVRGLEAVAPIDADLVKAFQEKGGVHVTASN